VRIAPTLNGTPVKQDIEVRDSWLNDRRAPKPEIPLKKPIRAPFTALEAKA
jgi:hypothetical protein